MPRLQIGLLSFGVLVIILAVLLVAFAPNWALILSWTLILYGLWIVVLAGIRSRTPEKYGRSAFSILIWGILILAVGGAWYLDIITQGNLLYSVVLLLVIIGVAALATAMRPRK